MKVLQLNKNSRQSRNPSYTSTQGELENSRKLIAIVSSGGELRRRRGDDDSYHTDGITAWVTALQGMALIIDCKEMQTVLRWNRMDTKGEGGGNDNWLTVTEQAETREKDVEDVFAQRLYCTSATSVHSSGVLQLHFLTGKLIKSKLNFDVHSVCDLIFLVI